MVLKVLDIFSGIGGFSLGLERTGGFQTVAFCEIEPYCRAVLRKHWPGVPIFEDVTKLGAADVGPVDVICGGFPCQQTSTAAAIHGRRKGLAGETSGLFSEILRLVRECHPKWCVVENPLGVETWAGEIARSLEGAGYGVSKSEFSASDLGLPHSRRRLFFVANLDGARLEIARPARSSKAQGQPWGTITGNFWRKAESGIWGMDDGLPGRMDRLRSLGNAVVPQVVEVVGRAILKSGSMPHAAGDPHTAAGGAG